MVQGVSMAVGEGRQLVAASGQYLLGAAAVGQFGGGHKVGLGVPDGAGELDVPLGEVERGQAR